MSFGNDKSRSLDLKRGRVSGEETSLDSLGNINPPNFPVVAQLKEFIFLIVITWHSALDPMAIADMSNTSEGENQGIAPRSQPVQCGSVWEE